MHVQTTDQVRSSRRGRVSDSAAARGKRLSAAMVARGWTYNCQVAYDLKVTESSLSRWRSGGPMSVENAIALAEHLGTSIDWLVLGRDWTDEAPTPYGIHLAEVVSLFSVLSPGDRQLVLALNHAMVDSQVSLSDVSPSDDEDAPAPAGAQM